MSKAVANLTQSTETITFSAKDNGETISVNITEAARGPAGTAGSNQITTATTTDLTGYIFGDGSFIGGATTATADPDPSTLVLRDSLGEAEFEGLRVNPGGSPDGDFDVGGGVFNVDMQTLSASCSGTFTALDVQATTATVSGTLTANHIHGNLAGSVYAHVRAGEALAKGDPVYVSGSHGIGANLIAIVSKANASDPLKMPAIGIVDAAIANNASGHMVIIGTITGINTAAYSVNAELYVAEGGGFTATAPNAYAQPVARVERSNTNNGAIIVKVNGLSAYSNTGNTLVRRSASGDATFSALQFPSEGIGTTELGVNNDGSLESSPSIVLPGASGTLALTDNFSGVVGIAYGGTNATTVSDARANLSLGPTGTITTSQPLSLTQTWSTTATYKAIDVNITDSGPANAASLLMDLRVGGVSQCKVNKIGLLTCAYINAQTFSSTFAGITSVSTGIFSQFGGRIGISSTGYLGFSSSSDATGALDTIILRDVAANTLAQRNGANAQVTRIYDTYTSATDYHRLAIATARATATAMSGATVTLTNIIPAGAVVVGVTCKVTTAITGATSFDIGTATDVDRFGAAIAVALGTTSDNRNWTAGTIECFPTATSLILTANGSNFTAGAVYVSVQYLSGQAD